MIELIMFALPVFGALGIVLALLIRALYKLLVDIKTIDDNYTLEE